MGDYLSFCAFIKKLNKTILLVHSDNILQSTRQLKTLQNRRSNYLPSTLVSLFPSVAHKMSSSITIPTRSASKAAATSSSSSSSYSSSPPTPQQSPSSASSSPNSRYGHDRKRSFLSSSLSKQEHTVINIGDPDGTPRLVRQPLHSETRGSRQLHTNTINSRSPVSDRHKASTGIQKSSSLPTWNVNSNHLNASETPSTKFD
ncbi:hypothetical protein ACMFMG_003858 [Clarireedia jacksonii]